VNGSIGYCPICKADTLFAHCPSDTCSWARCRNKACASTLDLKRRRGFRQDPKEGLFERVRWTS
jgi:hypothetical protein